MEITRVIDVEVRRCWEVGTWIEVECSPVESVVSIGSNVAVVLGDIDIAGESEGSAGGITGNSNVLHLGGGVDMLILFVGCGDDAESSV